MFNVSDNHFLIDTHLTRDTVVHTYELIVFMIIANLKGKMIVFLWNRETWNEFLSCTMAI